MILGQLELLNVPDEATLAPLDPSPLDLAALHALVERALRSAQLRPLAGDSAQERHRARSRHFVVALADALRAHEGEDAEALSRYHADARARLGTNELLHDITVCRCAKLEDRPLWYVREVLWQVESELAQRRRAALHDFNKLVLGSARDKLFVASRVADPDDLRRLLGPVAARCTGRVFLALIPHPSRWDDDGGGAVQTWQLHP